MTDSANNSQYFWQAIIKKFFPSKESVTCSKSYLIDGISQSKPSLIASKLYSFFSCIAGQLKSTSILLKNFVWSQPYQNPNKSYTTFKFTPVPVNETFKHLKKLKRKKASDIDNLSPGFFKDIAFNIAKPLSHLINVCLSADKMPKAFKNGKITSFFKNGSKHQFDNYRPIIVLPICSKNLERCIHFQLMNHIETHKLLSQSQYGFRSKQSTEAAATIFVDSVRKIWTWVN